MTTNVVFHDATRDSGYAVISGTTMVSQNITESASNQLSNASTKPFVSIISTVAIYVAMGGSTPDATVATGRIMLAANQPRTFGIGVGDKVAIVTV